jgi:protein-L-isoaspartate(D-aspartate) O-methyltransferase
VLFADDRYVVARHQLVKLRIEAAGVKNPRVLAAMRATLRHEFVPADQRERAYLDMALPIGESQTISSPFIVASMTESLEPKPTDRVLEIGTGSGYQAAVLSPLVAEVYSIEIVESLGKQAAETLERLGYKNVFTRVGDGFQGWPDAAPFDKIIVTCSPENIPQPLADQLAEGGMIVIPVGERYQQTLYRLTKHDGELKREALQPTLFVPMTGAAEQKRVRQPNPSQPKIINGDFEEHTTDDIVNKTDVVPGWYYGRQVRQIRSNATEGQASQGQTFVRFENETPGLNSHLLQGIAIDGRRVSMLKLKGSARITGVTKGPDPESMPMIAISLYDEQRKDLGTSWIGPFRDSKSWRTSSRLVRIPKDTREAIVRVGLFGATGQADFDDISLEAID